MHLFIPSPVREGSTLFGDHSGSILLNRAGLKPVRRVSADANLKEISAKITLG